MGLFPLFRKESVGLAVGGLLPTKTAKAQTFNHEH